MGGTGIGTSLILIATGAVLAFAVNLQTTGIDIHAVGAILLVIGLLGLVFSLMFWTDLGASFGRGSRTYHDDYVDDGMSEHSHTTTTTRRASSNAPVDGDVEVTREETVHRRSA